MSGSKDDHLKNISALLKKRERILRDTLRSQEAYWVMLKDNNLKQIDELFRITNSSIKNITEIDQSLGREKESFSEETAAHVQKELHKQSGILQNIIEQDKKIMASLKQKKILVSESLDKNRTKMKFTKAYSQNVQRNGFNKLDKKI